MIKKIIILAFFVWLALGPVGSSPALADDAYSQLGAAQAASGFGAAADPRSIAINVIKVAFGLLGMIFVILVLYAGYEWMTAGGNDEKVDSAKKLLTRAVIGLAIIFLSYSITDYIFSIATGPAIDPDRWRGGFTF